MLLGLAACTHEKPFTPDNFTLDSTLTRGSDRQLTYNLGTDRGPAWRPDGSGLFYMLEEISQSPRDRCMGEFLPSGGTLRQVICPVSPGSLDSLDTLYEPSPGPNGQLLYLREASHPNGITPISSALMLANLADPLNATIVQSYPYTAQNGKIHEGISHIRWLSETLAVYLAEKVLYLRPCPTCPADTVRTGIEIVRVDLSGSTPTTSIVPNTEETSSIAAGAGPDQVIVTRNGDTRVYQMALSTGATTILFDFGAGKVVRDAQVTGNRLYAIVGGEVTFVIDSVLGSVQRDAAGQLVVVDLGSGTASPIFVSERLFRRPVVSPGGGRLVAEGFVTIITGPPPGDTTISKLADLWLFDIP